MPPEIKIVSDATELYRAAADEFANCAKTSIQAHGKLSVALSGGSTPRGIYSLLAEDQKNPAKKLPWEKVFIFFGDERNVPPTDPESNYRMANESLLSKVPIPKENIFRIAAELDANTAATQYEQQLTRFFNLKPNEWPRFDLIMLGMGPDGHTASLFPGSPALDETQRKVVANWVEKLKTHRITFTFPVLNHAAEVMFTVSGSEKAEVLKDVLENPDKSLYPSQRVQPEDGKLLWIIDKAATRLL
ncbi:MAG TPA: 6-phosphogluconolactonase [Candidatus Angelobacter sp.]|jgi:6-phosphogluconolactonase|nr:6-phosphogluconolactonase [Candidatus Angelobacter sp.]